MWMKVSAGRRPNLGSDWPGILFRNSQPSYRRNWNSFWPIFRVSPKRVVATEDAFSGSILNPNVFTTRNNKRQHDEDHNHMVETSACVQMSCSALQDPGWQKKRSWGGGGRGYMQNKGAHFKKEHTWKHGTFTSLIINSEGGGGASPMTPGAANVVNWSCQLHSILGWTLYFRSIPPFLTGGTRNSL